MIGELISVGTEILIGDTLNTNAQYISRELAQIGFTTYYHTTVGDNPSRLKSTLELSLSRSDIVILTGGLGPTQDDLTKETVAQVFGVEMVFHQESHDTLMKILGHSKNISPNNFKQAYMPEGSSVIPNHNGTAPGILMEKEGKVVILLPGPPREMIPMFQETVLPFLISKSEVKFFSNYYKVTSLGESVVEDMLLDVINGQSNPTIATYAKVGDVLLRVTANAKTQEIAEVLLEKVDAIIKERLGDNLYATEDISLHEVVAKFLMNKGLSLSIAESCTGGRIVSRLTEIPGISSCLHSGIVCYSNDAKVKFIGVKQETLDNYGAVSEETATEMLQGLYEQTKSDIIIATTGIAGPGGGSDEKPVGLVYIGILFNGKCIVEEHQIIGSRERIQMQATNIALNMIRKTIGKHI